MAHPESDTANPGLRGSITLQVIQARLAGIVQEMQNSLFRTGFSTIIRESQDASCAILTCDARLRRSTWCCRFTWERSRPAPRGCCGNYPPEEIHEGDAFITNHPYLGGSPTHRTCA